MHRSTDRILTTHVGSLPRSQAVVDVLFARQRAEAGAAANACVQAPGEGEAVIAAAVAEVVRRQVALGIDVVSDGEMSKISYATYVARRLTGFADRKSTRLNSSHSQISYAVFCLKKKKKKQ